MDNNIIPDKSGQQEEGEIEKKQQTKKGPKGGVGGKSRGAKVVGKRGGGKTKMAKKVMRSARAGLYFPVSRVHRQFKRKTIAKGRVSGTAAVYTTAILEYLVAEILELAGNAAKSFNLKRVTPRHLYLAVRGDEELDTLIRGTIAGGGVVPHIHRMLMSKPDEMPRAMAAEQQNMMAMMGMPSTSKAEGIAVTNAMVAQQAQAKGKGPAAVATDEHDYAASQATAQEADRDSMLSERDSSVDVREL